MHADWQVPGCNDLRNSDGVLVHDYALLLLLIVL